MFGIGTQEMMLILVIVLVLFGGSRLPELAKGLGRSMKEFRKGLETGDGPGTGPSSTASAAPATCASCARALEPGWSHCPHCGASVGAGPTRPA